MTASDLPHPRVRASIILPVSGDAERTLRCLAALAELPDEPAHEVVIVDDASVGLEGLLARLDGDVEIVRSPRRVGLAGALRLGADAAQGDVLVLLTGPLAVGAGFLDALLRTLDDERVAAASATDAVPAAAPALACRATDLREVGGIPAVPDQLALAALGMALARLGAVERVPAAQAEDGTRLAGCRRAPGEPIELSIVIPTLDAASDRLRACVAAIQACTDAAHEIIVLDNGAPPQGFTAPVNAGLRAARGAYMIVVNDDVEVLAGWWPPLREALDAGAAVAFPLTVDGAMRTDFAAWCFALSRATLEEFATAPGEFLDPELVVWYQDTDLLVRLRAAGRPPQFVAESRVRHGLSQSVASDDPALKAWIQRQIRADQAAFEARHGAGVGGAAR
jgi:GT2 family glycosyltransferase